MGNTVLNNTTDGSGGGLAWSVWTEGASPYLLNNTITGNRAVTGSAIAGATGGAVVVNNVATGPPGTSVVWCSAETSTEVTFSHNDVYNGTPSPYQGCADPIGTMGNISADPRFGFSGADKYYHPVAGSPVVDAGHSLALLLPSVDHFGDPRVTDGNGDGAAVVDLGAVELAAVPAIGARYHPLSPARILDTRIGLGSPAAPVGPASTLQLRVSGVGGVPATGVSAAVLNVTVTEPASGGHLTAWPARVPRPVASNLNFEAGQTVPNLVVVKVGDGGNLNLYNGAGRPT